MEEKKVKMEVNQPVKEKPTYEQLEQQVGSLMNQLRQMYAELQKRNMENAYKRLDYLFKVVENSERFNEDFAVKCSDEIESLMIIPEENTDKPVEENAE